MRPQDIVILLKLVCLRGQAWQYRDLASYLFMPLSEISGSLKRSEIAGLYNPTTRNAHRQALMEFMQYGLRYVFPVIPGGMVTGVPTAHSHPFYADYFISEMTYVWPDLEGDKRGLSIEPLHSNVPKAVRKDEQLYKLLASVDIVRVGRVREMNKAIDELKKMLK